MPTPRQLEAQLKREQKQAKRDLISYITEIVLYVLHESQLFGSNLWPKNGFVPGYRGQEELDTINIIIVIGDNNSYKKVRFNIWGKEARVLKQRKQLVLIFDQSVYNDVYFYPQYPEFTDRLMAHYHDGFIMDMLDFGVTIKT